MNRTQKFGNRLYDSPMDNPQSRDHKLYKKRVNRFTTLAVICLSLFYAVQVHGAGSVTVFLVAATVVAGAASLGLFLVVVFLWETYRWVMGHGS